MNTEVMTAEELRHLREAHHAAIKRHQEARVAVQAAEVEEANARYAVCVARAAFEAAIAESEGSAP